MTRPAPFRASYIVSSGEVFFVIFTKTNIIGGLYMYTYIKYEIKNFSHFAKKFIFAEM